MSSSLETLAPGFLIAAPTLKDPNFDRTVVLMCIHSEEGAMGLVINRMAPFTIKDILVQLGLECESNCSQNAMLGGPVALDSGLLLYQVNSQEERREDELYLTDELRLCPNRDLLQTIGRGNGPPNYHMFLGHAGWGSGQLEQEISQGVWIPAVMEMDLIFATPIERRWEEALRNQGFFSSGVPGKRPQA
jgi:putative transcriptional regulator